MPVTDIAAPNAKVLLHTPPQPVVSFRTNHHVPFANFLAHELF